MTHKFTYLHKISLGNDRTASYELDCEYDVNMDGTLNMYVYCYDLQNYEPVCNKTDMYRDMVEYAFEHCDAQTNIADHMRGVVVRQKLAMA